MSDEELTPEDIEKAANDAANELPDLDIDALDLPSAWWDESYAIQVVEYARTVKLGEVNMIAARKAKDADAELRVKQQVDIARYALAHIAKEHPGALLVAKEIATAQLKQVRENRR